MGKWWRWLKNKFMSPCATAHHVEDSSRSLDIHQPIHNVEQSRKRALEKWWILKRAWPFSSLQYQRQAAAAVMAEEQEEQLSSNAVARAGLELKRVEERLEEGKPKVANNRQEESQMNQPYSAMHERKNSQTLLAAAVAAVEAAMAAAQVVDQVTRLIGDGGGATNFMNISSSTPPRTCNSSPLLQPSSYSKDREMAATKIQSLFRGYLAKRAVKALKLSVRLQVLVRGNSAQQQAASAMRCIQSMIKVQAQVQARRLICLPEVEDEVNLQSRLWRKHEEDIIGKSAESSVDIEIPSMMTMVDTGISHSCVNPVIAEINSNFNAGQQRPVPTFRFDHPSSRSGAIFLEKQGSVPLQYSLSTPVSKKGAGSTAAKAYGSGSPGRAWMADKVTVAVPSWVYSSAGESADDRHAGCSPIPSYMAATLSAKARYFNLNSTNAKQWFKRIEREMPSPSSSSLSSPSVKKRLSYSPINPRCGNTSPGRRCPNLPIK